MLAVSRSLLVAGTRIPYTVRSITAVLRGLSTAVLRGHILVLVLFHFVPLLPFLVNSTMQQGLVDKTIFGYYD